MEIIKIDEYDIDVDLESKILELLTEGFPEVYPVSRIYYKQIPHFRYIAYDIDRLIAQVGLDYRVMNLNGCIIRVLGIIDLCVKTEYRGKGIGSQLLETIEYFSKDRNIDFLILFADIEALYKNNAFLKVKNTCIWTKIDESRTIGIAEKEVHELMIKNIGNKVWDDGYLDMLGYLY